VWDGVGVVLKIRFRFEQLHNPTKRLQCGEEVVSFLEETLFS
jgi:hypothetical protein